MAMKKHDIYVIRKSWNDKKSQIKRATIDMNEAINSCPAGYTVFNMRGEVIYHNAESQALIHTTNYFKDNVLDYKYMWHDLKLDINNKRDAVIYDIRYINSLPILDRIKLNKTYRESLKSLDELTRVLLLIEKMENNYEKRNAENGTGNE